MVDQDRGAVRRELGEELYPSVVILAGADFDNHLSNQKGSDEPA
jgi:hypothetical protein